MEVMGGLIVLDSTDRLPIPWYMRSHLGLETGCKVFFALTPVGEDTEQLPDIVVSPLDPRQFHAITNVTLANREGIGTLAEVIRTIDPPVNIALADSVTIEGRARHRINLVIEKADGAEDDTYVARRTEFIRSFSKAPDTYDYDLSVTEIGQEERKFTDSRAVRVKNGWVSIGDLFTRIQNSYSSLVDKYDLRRLVISSNPDQRLVRYIIPRKGVMTLRIDHEDAPGVLRTIVQGIGDAGYNILCSRLSRVPPDDSAEKASVFVAECEPGPTADPPQQLIKSLVRDRVYKCRFDYGIRADDSLYIRRPFSVVALPQEGYRAGIRAEQARLMVANPAYRGDRRRCVFISRRFIETKPGIDPAVSAVYKQLLEALERGIAAAGWAMSSAPPDYAGKSIEAEIYPRLWVSDAVIVVAFFDDASGQLSPNQAHELGFYMGQNKPHAILVDNSKISDINVSNYAGRQILDYPINVAFHESNPSSISSRVRKWLEKVAKEL